MPHEPGPRRRSRPARGRAARSPTTRRSRSISAVSRASRSEQQARAENLIAITLLRLPQFADPAKAEAAGLPFDRRRAHRRRALRQPRATSRTVASSTPTTPSRSCTSPTARAGRSSSPRCSCSRPARRSTTCPTSAASSRSGTSTTTSASRSPGRSAGSAAATDRADAPLVKGPETPMIHVWIQKHPCGPFAALEGIGGGQIPEGETKLCDHAHGA